MGIVSAVIVFLCAWWTVLFAVLPWGIVRDENTEHFHGGGAPVDPQLKKKLLITTGLALLILLIIYVLIEIDVINFRQLAGRMMAEDLN